jgi:twitching motility protein PilT
VSTSLIRECITEEHRTNEIPDAIAQGHVNYGMQTFDQSLMTLVKNELVHYHDALRYSTNPNDFALRMKGVMGTSDGKWDIFETGGMAQDADEAPKQDFKNDKL